jgi:predicted phosphohydrolase
MKICAISDIHGQFEGLQIQPVDILFICGDIVPLRMQRNIPQSLSWFKKFFIPWCQSQPADQIYMVGGNHDYLLEKLEREVKEALLGTNITILYNESAEYMDDNGKIWTIWGSPNCHIFGNWAFMYSDEYNKEMYERMPKNVDFCITHDMGYGRSDQCLGFISAYQRDLHRGNIPLAEVLEDRRPKYHFGGHLHTCDHNLIDYTGTKTACVSLLNEQYNKVYEPLYLEV